MYMLQIINTCTLKICNLFHLSMQGDLTLKSQEHFNIEFNKIQLNYILTHI
jgi:hypothetical protein